MLWLRAACWTGGDLYCASGEGRAGETTLDAASIGATCAELTEALEARREEELPLGKGGGGSALGAARGDATCSAPFVPFTPFCAGTLAGRAIVFPFANVSDTSCAKASRLASPSAEGSGACRDARSVSIEVDGLVTIEMREKKRQVRDAGE